MDSKVSFTGHIDVTVGRALAEEKKKVFPSSKTTFL
jgi:hypothetical protein